MTIISNAFQNELFKIIRHNDELAFSSSLIGNHPSLLLLGQEGAQPVLGSCRANMRFAISAKEVFVWEEEKKEEGSLSGAKAAAQLSTFLTHHSTRKPRVLSDKSLTAIQPVVESFCCFLRESLKGATLEKFRLFRLSIEAKFRSDITLWPPFTDSTSSPSKAGEKRKGNGREGTGKAKKIKKS